MRRALFGGLVSLAVTYAATPIVRRTLVRQGALDVPNHRSSHAQPVPRGGGLACLVGVACGLTATGHQSRVSRRVVVGLGGLALTGLADDRRGHVAPTVRLAAQSLSGAVLSPHAPAYAPLAAVATSGVVNVVNFMDGINGITGSTAGVWGISTLLASRATEDHALQTLGAITAGAGLGFLPWNAPKAQLFLGDVGSYLFGGLMAAGLTRAGDRPSLAWQVAAPLLPYGTDAALAITRRVRRSEPVTEAHRDHTYQRLVDEQRLTHSQVSTAHAATAAFVAVCARGGLPGAALALAAVGAYVTSPQWLPVARTARRG